MAMSEAYRTFLEEVLAGGSWHQFPRKYLQILGPRQAIMLSYLSNLAMIVKAEKKRKGWFYVHMSRLMKELAISSSSQTKLIRQLVEQKFLQTKTIKNRRNFKINYEKIVSSIAAVCNNSKANQPFEEDYDGEDDE